MNYEMVEKWGIFNGPKAYSHQDGFYDGEKLYDTKEDAEAIAKPWWDVEVRKVMTLVGDNDPGLASSEATEVVVTKYKDLNGEIWDQKKDADRSNAVIIINNVAGKEVLKFYNDFDGRNTIKWVNKQFTLEITNEKVIDALAVIFNWDIECEAKNGHLLNTCGGRYAPRWDEVEKQMNRPKLINKFMNMKKELKRSGKVKVLCKLEYYEDRDGDTYSERKILIFIGNEGKAYINNKPDDRSCKTCAYRGTDCGYNVSEGNLKPRCYRHATQEDITKRPDVYADTYTEIEKPMYSEFDKGNFEENFKCKFDPNTYDDEIDDEEDEDY